MKLKLHFIFIVLCASIISSAQQLPIDFSTSNDIFSGFSGSGFSFRTSSPSSNANRGGQFFNDGSNASQGFFIDLAQPLTIDATNQVFSLDFYAFDPNNHSIILKLEDASNTDVQVKVSFSVPSPSAFTTINFDFNNAVESADSSTPTSVSGNYNRLVLFIDEGTTTPGTYIIDDITNTNENGEPINPNEIDVVYSDLVWSDEFDGANGALDTNPTTRNWFQQIQLPTGNGGDWFNGEVQHYTNRVENSKIEDGFLIITAKRENYSDQGFTKDFTSARLNSTFAFTYGRVDVRAKLPFGNGTWPAIWTLGKNINEDGAYWDNQGFGTVNWPACGEIDIMEHGLHDTNEVSSALHTPSSFGNTFNNAQNMLADVANDFHVYSMNWSPDKIVFLIDEVPFYSYNPSNKNANNWPFTEDQYILLNIAMGGIAGNIDSSFTQSEMVVDYVRVFQNNSLSTSNLEDVTVKPYPNPASTILNIDTIATILSIKVYDILGKEIKSQIKSDKIIDVSGFKNGMYLIKIETSNGEVVKKIMID